MAEDYEVRQGDCLNSIAYEHGFFWETIWNHPRNAELKRLRQNPDVILPGDVLYIPDKEEKTKDCATERKHRFKLRGVPARFYLRLLDDDEPRANLPFTLFVDDQRYTGKTDAEGNLEVFIQPNARTGRLIVGTEGDEEYDLNFGHIDPIDSMTGVQSRLANLNYACEVTGEMDDDTETALKEFQYKYHLSETGTPDAATKAKLVQIYGC